MQQLTVMAHAHCECVAARRRRPFAIREPAAHPTSVQVASVAVASDEQQGAIGGLGDVALVQACIYT